MGWCLASMSHCPGVTHTATSFPMALGRVGLYETCIMYIFKGDIVCRKGGPLKKL